MRSRHLLALTCLIAGASQAQELNVISAVDVKDEGTTVVVTVKGTRPPNFTTFSMADPPRFVIDLSESQFSGVAESLSVEDGVISVVKNLSYGSGATSIARVMVAFLVEVEPPDVQSVGNDLLVRVAKPPAAAAAALAVEAAQQAKDDALAQARADDAAKAQVEAEAQAQAQAQTQAATEAQVRAQAEADRVAREASAAKAAAEAEAVAAQARVADAEREVAAARSAEIKAKASAQEAPPDGVKLAEEGVVVAPAEDAAVTAAAAERQAKEEAAAQARAAAEAKAAAIEQVRADAEARRLAAAETRTRAAEELRARKEADRLARLQARAEAQATKAAEAEARAAAAAERKAAAAAAAAEKQAAAAAAVAARRATAEAERQARAEAKQRAREEAEAARVAALEARRLDVEARAAAKAAALAGAGPATRLAEVGFQQVPGASRVFLRTSAPPRFTVTDVGDDVVRIELENTRATRRNDTRFLDTSFFASPVALVTPSMRGSSYVVDIKLRQRVPYQQKVEGDMLALDFERPPSAAEAAALPAADEPAATEGEGILVAPPDAPAEAPAEPAPKL